MNMQKYLARRLKKESNEQLMLNFHGYSVALRKYVKRSEYKLRRFTGKVIENLKSEFYIMLEDVNEYGDGGPLE